ncbi:MAG: hypothetical protein EOO11_19180 [Chitinophagaceae bacterium]|nr:MAG: hypothetical protein EOO11_19180 [Chitinophagaceae bacterium]
MENSVALWVGNFSDESALRSYVDLQYDDEGEATSPFAQDAGLEWYDEDLVEVMMIDPEDPLRRIGEATHAGSFVSRLQPLAAALTGRNACILLYDLEDEVDMRPGASVSFIGTFSYIKKEDSL